MAKKLRTYLKRKDGTPWPFGGVLQYAVDRIRAASIAGTGLHLSAEEIRALEWATIRENGGLANTDDWREGAWDEIGEPDPNARAFVPSASAQGGEL